MVNEDQSIHPRSAMTNVRWTICALLFAAMTINYMDRQVFSQMTPYFEDDLKLGPTDIALINVSFILPYGIAMVFVGRFIDRIGVKKGLGGLFLLWNVASIAHGLIRSLTGFIGARFALGIGECAMYPSGVKTITDWFPVRDRSLVTGILNAGANFGAVLAPLVGVYLADNYGWRICFMVTGGLGLIWLVFWNRLYKPPTQHPGVSPEELAYIEQDREPLETKIGYHQLFAMRPIYALAIGKALSDAPFWFYLTWMPKFFTDQFHISSTFMKVAIPIIYIVADLGSVAGGWLSSSMIAHRKSIGSSRKLAMLVCALVVLPVMSVGQMVDTPSLLGVPCVYWAVALTALAAGGHQGFSSNLFTLISDTTPKSATGMAVGAINGFAMVGVSAMQFFVGKTVQLTSSYTLPFIVAGSLYLVALAVIHLMMPKVEKSPSTKRANLVVVGAGAAAVLAGLGLLQYATNRPQYLSLNDYLKSRPAELKSSPAPIVGPDATVGWMSARWYCWAPRTYDLVKFDTAGHPYIEAKGAKASKYHGPSLDQVKAQTSRN